MTKWIELLCLESAMLSATMHNLADNDFFNGSQ